MEEIKDFEDQNKWGTTMDTQAHLSGYKNFILVGVITIVGSFAILIFMAMFLT